MDNPEKTTTLLKEKLKIEYTSEIRIDARYEYIKQLSS
jgi:hypothetical protein